MGLPEVADFARKFAVMVRAQGPDPKGVKMRNHAFHHYNSGKTMISASGMILPASNGSVTTGSGCDLKSSETVLVLTAASVIEPFVSQQYRENTSKDKPRLIPGVRIDVLMEGKSMVDGNMEALPWIPAELLKMVNIPQSSVAVQSLIEASCGSLESTWEVGWSLASHSRSPQHIPESSHAQVEQSSFQSHWPMARMESSDPNLMGQSATRIALLAIPSKFSMNSLKLQASIPNRGEILLAMGSPFGILSPLHFFNNISVGSIGNSYPPSSFRRSLLMADIRCLPGMEGSPVFSEHAQFIGILTRPLRQKVSGTEIQMVIPWEAIASACSDLLQEEPHITWKGINYNNGNLDALENSVPKGYSDGLSNHLHEQIHSGSQLLSPVDKAMASICLITSDDGSWASGVLLNKQGLVLTNAHLLEPWRFGKTAAKVDRNESKPQANIIPNIHMRLETFTGERSSQTLLRTNLKAEDVTLKNENALSGCISANINHRLRVRLDFIDPWMWTDARVVYISKGPLDIALLQLETVPDQLCPIIMDVGRPLPGSKAYVIGHGLFGPRCDFLPSVCVGVIARVIEATRSLQPTTSCGLNSCQQFPAMLETTAAVHPGSSGGAVVNSDGCMIGLVTSNAKHGGGTVIPHLNFSIPCAALEPIFKFSKDMKDLLLLEELDKPNEHLSSVWALMPPLYPKPEPSPDTPQFPAEDNNNGTKGSRFAKFIADRNELLKKTVQHGMAGTFTNELIPSKL
ncbi:Glyoxysomal processing protease, glyoxysomal [Sesamum angolense]|uniref:Glyoxysomal processing protease, glyoxysomal n=1 Tax=Sesamum angolense TaxID=2727404 RepID=A0AAE2BV98_9LAMI|nr:Glyoxysomal processing protease, glyoxysomal [Sesamum angolense]